MNKQIQLNNQQLTNKVNLNKRRNALIKNQLEPLIPIRRNAEKNAGLAKRVYNQASDVVRRAQIEQQQSVAVDTMADYIHALLHPMNYTLNTRAPLSPVGLTHQHSFSFTREYLVNTQGQFALIVPVSSLARFNSSSTSSPILYLLDSGNYNITLNNNAVAAGVTVADTQALAAMGVTTNTYDAGYVASFGMSITTAGMATNDKRGTLYVAEDRDNEYRIVYPGQAGSEVPYNAELNAYYLTNTTALPIRKKYDISSDSRAIHYSYIPGWSSTNPWMETPAAVAENSTITRDLPTCKKFILNGTGFPAGAKLSVAYYGTIQYDPNFANMTNKSPFATTCFVDPDPIYRYLEGRTDLILSNTTDETHSDIISVVVPNVPKAPVKLSRIGLGSQLQYS